MPYKLTWYSFGEVLHLALDSDLSLEELDRINHETVEILNEAEQKMMLVIDVSKLVAGYQTVTYLRTTQHYMDHPGLNTIIVIANNKLNRLITLLAFNLGRARLIQFDSLEKTQWYMTQNGFSESRAAIT